MAVVTVTRKNLSFAQQVAIDRQGDDYVYGGTWNPFDREQGCDCSGCVVDILDAAINGTAMAWTRHGLSTEDWRPPSMGGSANTSNGPFGTVMVNNPSEFPANAAVKIAFHHGPGGGANSHTWCMADKLAIETNGDDGTVLNDGVNFHDNGLSVYDTSYGNNWWYLPGPIIEDGTPIPTAPSGGSARPAEDTVDTLFCDISEFQVPVDDSYPYQVLSIRVCDGTYQDHKFAQNYAWMRQALDSGKLTFGIVYTYVRPSDWAANGQTVMAMIDANGGLHPRVALMLDVETGGNPGGDQSGPINNLFNLLAEYAGSPARIIGYGNVSDLNSMWPNKPQGIRLIVAGYGSNPSYPGKVAHQYTDGSGFGGGLPEGASPFGSCDMNSADGLSPDDFAAACGIGSVAPSPPQDQPVSNPPAIPKPQDPSTQTDQIWDQVLLRWDQLNGHTLVEAIAQIGQKLGLPYTPSQ